MKAVRHLPVAEQYPSRTSMVSFFASKRISGMAISGIKEPANPKTQQAKPGCQSGRRETRLALGRPEVVGKRLNALDARIRRDALVNLRQR